MLFLQLFTGMEEDLASSVSRPVVLRQCVQRNYTFRPTKVTLLQGQLFYVQENVRAKAEGNDKRVWETREANKGNEGTWTV